MGKIFGGGGGKSQTSTSSSETTVNIPEWARKYLEQSVTRAADLSNQPYTPYDPNQMVAPLSADEQAAFELIRQQGGEYLPYIDQALGEQQSLLSEYLTAPTLEQLQPYMNPYLEQVLDRSKLMAERDYDKLNSQLQSQIGADAFGGSRYAVREDELADQYLDRIADLDITGRTSAYEQAMNLFNMNRQNRQVGASNLANIAGLGQGQLLNQVGALQTAGQQSRAIDQALADAKYGEFNRELQFPYGQIDFLSNIAMRPAGLYTGQTSTTGTTTTTQPSSGGSLFGKILGTGLSVASMGLPGGGTIGGSLFNSVFGPQNLGGGSYISSGGIPIPGRNPFYSEGGPVKGYACGGQVKHNRKYQDGGSIDKYSPLLAQVMDKGNYYPPTEMEIDPVSSMLSKTLKMISDTSEDMGRINYTGSSSVDVGPMKPGRKPSMIEMGNHGFEGPINFADGGSVLQKLLGSISDYAEDYGSTAANIYRGTEGNRLKRAAAGLFGGHLLTTAPKIGTLTGTRGVPKRLEELKNVTQFLSQDPEDPFDLKGKRSAYNEDEYAREEDLIDQFRLTEQAGTTDTGVPVEKKRVRETTEDMGITKSKKDPEDMGETWFDNTNIPLLMAGIAMIQEEGESPFDAIGAGFSGYMEGKKALKQADKDKLTNELALMKLMLDMEKTKAETRKLNAEASSEGGDKYTKSQKIDDWQNYLKGASEQLMNSREFMQMETADQEKAIKLLARKNLQEAVSPDLFSEIISVADEVDPLASIRDRVNKAKQSR